MDLYIFIWLFNGSICFYMIFYGFIYNFKSVSIFQSWRFPLNLFSAFSIEFFYCQLVTIFVSKEFWSFFLNMESTGVFFTCFFRFPFFYRSLINWFYFLLKKENTVVYLVFSLTYLHISSSVDISLLHSFSCFRNVNLHLCLINLYFSYIMVNILITVEYRPYNKECFA